MNRFRINAPIVVSEVIDGEAVIMNLESGDYFSARGLAAVIWQWIIAGHSHEEVVAAVQACWPASSVSAGVAAFTEKLEQHGLLAHAEPGAPAPAAPEPLPELAALASAPYAAPDLEAFSDMQDMLLLDPIHDVGEQGWPMPAPANPPGRSA